MQSRRALITTLDIKQRPRFLRCVGCMHALQSTYWPSSASEYTYYSCAIANISGSSIFGLQSSHLIQRIISYCVLIHFMHRFCIQVNKLEQRAAVKATP
jgi:hypothetical protein